MMIKINYISTRGGGPSLPFADAVLAGLAPDGGLFVPDHIPDCRAFFESWAALSYADLAARVFEIYGAGSFAELRPLMQEAYAGFDAPETVPLRDLGEVQVLELFHGPTLAFKDVALQVLGRIFARLLKDRSQVLNIVGATSGDTGSAAIHAVRGCERIRIFMLHPRGRTSPLQELQMTSVLDDNVFNLAVAGNFDDCQRMMKNTLGDPQFKGRYALGAVNSVNWCRILAQTVYYIYSGLRTLGSSGKSALQFAVPTGNFGNLLAGYYAQRMGLPIRRLMLATNDNDILARFFQTGTYRPGPAQATLSPSMDIQVASNFERYLYIHLEGQAETVREKMQALARDGQLVLPCPADGMDPLIRACSGSEADTRRTIAESYREHAYLLDPHSALGVYAARKLADPAYPTICLATAHPAKFPEVIAETLGVQPSHASLEALKAAPTRCDDIAIDGQVLQDYIAKRALTAIS